MSKSSISLVEGICKGNNLVHIVYESGGIPLIVHERAESCFKSTPTYKELLNSGIIFKTMTLRQYRLNQGVY